MAKFTTCTYPKRIQIPPQTAYRPSLMTDPLTFAMAKIALGARAADGIKSLKESVEASQEADPGRVFDRVRTLKESRAHVFPGVEYTTKKSTSLSKDPVESPLVNAFQNLYGDKIHQGVINVLFDGEGNGKSAAGLSILQNYYAFDDDGNSTIKGFMVSTHRVNQPYVETMASLLEASSVKGWFHALLLAMNEPAGSLPSLLILDDFTNDADGKNIDFIEHLYKLMNPPLAEPVNMIVVVITASRDAADKVCALNGGKRVVPLKGFYEGSNLVKPGWKGVLWSVDQLIEVVMYHYPGDFQDFSFVDSGMTPYEVLKEARSLRLAAMHKGKKKPSSPIKKRKLDETQNT